MPIYSVCFLTLESKPGTEVIVFNKIHTFQEMLSNLVCFCRTSVNFIIKLKSDVTPFLQLLFKQCLTNTSQQTSWKMKSGHICINLGYVAIACYVHLSLLHVIIHFVFLLW